MAEKQPLLTAAQAQATVTGLNKRVKRDIPDFLLRERDNRPRVHIFNLFPVEFRKQIAPHGYFIIPACPDNGSSNPENWDSHSKALVIDGIIFQHYDKGEGELALDYLDGRDVAKDITGEAELIPANDLRRWGVFIAAGDTPTKAELAEAKRRLNETMHLFLQQGDELWNGTQAERNQLGPMHRRAAAYMRADRAWDTTVQVMTDCKFCFQKVHPDAAKCSHCGSILDRQKWDQGQDGYVATDAKPKLGKPAQQS
jgi:hypothetical protein